MDIPKALVLTFLLVKFNLTRPKVEVKMRWVGYIKNDL